MEHEPFLSIESGDTHDARHRETHEDDPDTGDAHDQWQIAQHERSKQGRRGTENGEHEREHKEQRRPQRDRPGARSIEFGGRQCRDERDVTRKERQTTGGAEGENPGYDRDDGKQYRSQQLQIVVVDLQLAQNQSRQRVAISMSMRRALIHEPIPTASTIPKTTPDA